MDKCATHQRRHNVMCNFFNYWVHNLMSFCKVNNLLKIMKKKIFACFNFILLTKSFNHFGFVKVICFQKFILRLSPKYVVPIFVIFIYCSNLFSFSGTPYLWQKDTNSFVCERNFGINNIGNNTLYTKFRIIDFPIKILKNFFTKREK